MSYAAHHVFEWVAEVRAPGGVVKRPERGIDHCSI